MPNPPSFVLGEFRRTLDQRYRVSIPGELARSLGAAGANCILAKERPGAISLWSGPRWRDRLERGVRLVESKMDAGRLDGRIEEVQMLGRLLSTRHKTVELGDRGRLLIPEGFREFLGVEPGGELLVVGAALCVELWKPTAWIAYLEEQIPEFRRLFDSLSA